MSYSKSGLNKVVKDNSGFTPKQRHDIIIATLKEFKKGPQAFKCRWTENSGEYLTDDILLQTPMFWFMKYKWSRAEIETLFFKARVVIDSKFDTALQQTFGGDPGPRWKGVEVEKKQNSKRSKFKLEDEKQVKEDQQLKNDMDPSNNDKTKKQNDAKSDTLQLNIIPDYSKWKEPNGDNICQIYMECPDGITLTLNVKMVEPLHYLKKQIENKTNSKYEGLKQKILLNNVELLNNDDTLQSYSVNNGDTMQLSMGPIPIYVEKKNGTRIQIMEDPHTPIVAIKQELEKNEYPLIPVSEQHLYRTQQRDIGIDNELIDDDKSLFKYGIKEGDVLYLGGPTVWRAPTGDDGYQIFVECPDGATLELNVTGKDDIDYIRLQIQTVTKDKYAVDEQKLFFKRDLLSDNDKMLKDYNIVKNDTLQLSTGSIPIFIETRERKIIDLMVDPHELISNVKQLIQNRTDGSNDEYPVDEQQLFNQLNQEELVSNDATLFKYGIVGNSKLYLGGTIAVQIRKPDNMVINLDIDPIDKVAIIKQIIEDKDKTSVEHQTLYFQNIELEDDKSVKTYNIKKHDIIDLKITNIVSDENKVTESPVVNEEVLTEEKPEKTIQEETTEKKHYAITVGPATTKSKKKSTKKKKQKQKQKHKKKEKQSLESDNNELFNDIYGQNGELIIGAITSTQKPKKTKKKSSKKKVISDKNDYDDLFNIDDLMVGKITSSSFKRSKNEKKEDGAIKKSTTTTTTTKKQPSITADPLGMDDFFDPNDLMIGKITSSGFKKQKKDVQITKSMSTQDLNGNTEIQPLQRSKTTHNLGMDIDAVFDLTEIDLIVNDLSKYDGNTKKDVFPGYNEYYSDEFSSESSYSKNSDSYKGYYSDDTERRYSSIHNMPKITKKSTLKVPMMEKNESKRVSEILREIEFDEVDNDEMIQFENKRKQDMVDLMAGFFTDDDDDDEDDEYLDDDIKNVEMNKEKECEEMTVIELMKFFNLKTNGALYSYYNKALNIKFAKNFVDHLPTDITQPKQFKSTKIRMLLTKMSKFIMKKVMNGEWDGIKAMQWKELETNTISHTYMTAQTVEKTVILPSDTIECENIYFENNNNNKSNRIQIIGAMTSFIDKKIALNTECNINIKIEESPDIDNNTGHQNAMIIGIAFFNKNNNDKYYSLHISNRCAIYMNDAYLLMLSMANCVMIENGSEIMININNKEKDAIITFKHLRNGKLHKYNDREIIIDNLEKQENGSFVKIFIQQFYGEGIYSIYEIIKKNKINNEKQDKNIKKVIKKSINKTNNKSDKNGKIVKRRGSV